MRTALFFSMILALPYSAQAAPWDLGPVGFELSRVHEPSWRAIYANGTVTSKKNPSGLVAEMCFHSGQIAYQLLKISPQWIPEFSALPWDLQMKVGEFKDKYWRELLHVCAGDHSSMYFAGTDQLTPKEHASKIEGILKQLQADLDTLLAGPLKGR
jgi:hypothetical protein